MASRRLSAVWERKGSMESDRESKLGVRVSLAKAGLDSISETEVGGLRVPDLRREGI